MDETTGVVAYRLRVGAELRGLGGGMLDDVAEQVGGPDGERGVSEREVSRPAVGLAEHSDPAGGIWL
jgi:hypothetical protein